jgi:LMBR1 domain-containing protein 1
MVDVFMIIMICILSAMLIATSIYLLIYYSHKDEPSSFVGVLCKIAVIIGMTLSWAQVLMLPLDVSNVHGQGGGIDMKLFWFIVYLATAVFIVIIIPALIFWYESDPDWTCVRIS